MNEFSALLRRAFEGLGFCQAEFEDAAQSVVWLEARGLGGVQMLSDAWPRFSGIAGGGIDIEGDDAGVLHVNAQESTLLVSAIGIVELARARATANEPGRVDVRLGHDSLAMLPALACVNDESLYAIAAWRDAASRLHAGVRAPGGSNPDYRCIDKPAHSYPAASLSLVCARDRDTITTVARNLGFDSSGPPTVSGQEMIDRYTASLHTGITVDDTVIKMLYDAADRVLVESTDQSRRGAGEAA